jgi:hypothetical protein
MTSAQLVPAVLVPLVVWRIYRRVRRNIGPQPYQPRRLKARVIIFSVLILLFAAVAARDSMSLLAYAGGIAASVLLGWLGVRLTTFQREPDAETFTPNTLIGVILSLILVGRIVYRFVVLYSAMQAGVHPPATPLQSPLTMIILGLTFGYYVAYYAGVLIHWKRTHPGVPA